MSPFVRSPTKAFPLSDWNVIGQPYPVSDQVVASYLRRGRLTWHCFRQFREMIYGYYYLVIPRICQAGLLVIYLHTLNSKLSTDFRGKFIFLGLSLANTANIRSPIFHKRSSSLASQTGVKFLLHLVFSLMSHLIARSEQHLRLINPGNMVRLCLCSIFSAFLLLQATAPSAAW